ncbi:MAG: hypothetical protein AAFY20_00490 [Cyanobacteria bacterium J06639_14]
MKYLWCCHNVTDTICSGAGGSLGSVTGSRQQIEAGQALQLVGLIWYVARPARL